MHLILCYALYFPLHACDGVLPQIIYMRDRHSSCCTRFAWWTRAPDTRLGVLGIPSGDEYRVTLDNGNVTKDKCLRGVMVRRAASVCGSLAASCEPGLVEIRTVRGRLCPCVSTNRGPQRRLRVVPSAPQRFTPSGSVSGSVLSSGCGI